MREQGLRSRQEVQPQGSQTLATLLTVRSERVAIWWVGAPTHQTVWWVGAFGGGVHPPTHVWESWDVFFESPKPDS